MASVSARRTASTSSSGTSECPLFMDFTEEPLSEAQQRWQASRTANFQEQLRKVEAACRAPGGRIVSTEASGAVTIRSTESSAFGGGAMQGQAGSTAGYRVLMDTSGRIVGTINGPGASPGIRPTIRPVITNPAGIQVALGPRGIRPTTPALTKTSPVATSAAAISNPTVVDVMRVTAASANKAHFPTLNVQPKGKRTAPNLQARRSELDSKVKSLLIMTPAKFTEWLMQQKLIPEQQFYKHGNSQPVKLKLGMYSNAKQHPHSGGYVWIWEQKPTVVVSVFKKSVFESASLAPTVVLKLMYHWACQTSLANVVQWVKVDHSTINEYYTLFRGICVATIQEDMVGLGGQGKVVEIGRISLGILAAVGNKREVRVEVMGVLDRSTGHIRLRASEPDSTSSASRLSVYRPLAQWIQWNSKLVTDFSIDASILRSLGFSQVLQAGPGGKRVAEGNNAQIMTFLKTIVPKVFQNSLASLSTAQIQQLLDELSFRESFGYYPLMCFETLMAKASEQTRSALDMGASVVARLKGAAENPFADWKLSAVPGMMDSFPLPVELSVKKRSDSVGDSEADAEEAVAKKLKVTSERVNLESYFYATLQGDMQVLSEEFKADMAFKCHLCKKVYMNNIEFMKHLSLHVESDRASAVDLSDLCQCKYCFRDFETPFAMQTHLEEHHWKKGFEFVCKICEEGFKVCNLLIHHMSTTHVRSEMPYLCQVCGFRCSFHSQAVDHFQEAHDRTDKLHCPQCLRTFGLSSGSEKAYNSAVAGQFVTHMQGHQDKRKFNCKKCCLNFQSEPQLKQHLERDHVSFKGFANLEVYSYSGHEEPIQMPKPDERKARSAARKSGLVKGTQQSAFAAQNLEDMLMYNVDNEDCGECGRKMVNKDHYSAYLCCTKCRYSTCCSNSMSIHVTLFHGGNKPEFTLGFPVNLPSELHCICGFKSNSGNKMAKHLGVSGCKSAYPDRETAKKAIRPISSASFAPLIDIDEEEGDVVEMDPSVAMAKAYLKQDSSKKSSDEERRARSEEGPLAFLGLQRRSVDEDAASHAHEDTPMEINADQPEEPRLSQEAGPSAEERFAPLACEDTPAVAENLSSSTEDPPPIPQTDTFANVPSISDEPSLAPADESSANRTFDEEAMEPRDDSSVAEKMDVDVPPVIAPAENTFPAESSGDAQFPEFPDMSDFPVAATETPQSDAQMTAGDDVSQEQTHFE